MNQRTLLFSIAAVAFMAFVVIDPTFAQSGGGGGGGGDASTAGGDAVATLVGAITGNIGLLIGLAITVAGLWTWIIGQKTAAGLTMVIGGVLLTMAPGLFKGVRDVAVGVVGQFGDGAYDVDSNQGSVR